MSSDQIPDRVLVDAFLRTRSEEAFDALYARHAPRMYGLARRLLGRAADDADDVLQTAWLRAATRLETFRGDSALSTWLCGFIVNCCRERFGERGRAAASSAEPAHTPSFDHPIDIHRALADLAEGYRTVLLLHDVEGYTHEQIAWLLEIDPGTSKSQLSRARRAMRERLEPAPKGAHRD